MQSLNTKIIKMVCILFIAYYFFNLFDKSFAIFANVIMLFVSLYFLISLFCKLSCNIFSYLSIDTFSQCEEVRTHLSPALNIGPINERKPRELRSPSLSVVL
jgi:hypothetical protein